MLIQEAINLDVRVAILDPDAQAPCSALAHRFVCGSLLDYNTVLEFGRGVDCITVEIEHVNTDALAQLEKEGKRVYPAPAFLQLVKDKGTQKQFYAANNIPTASFFLADDIRRVPQSSLQFPFVLKSRTGGYDGKGVQIIRSANQIEKTLEGPCVIETLVPFTKELAIIISRNSDGETATFPIVEMEFNPEANLVEFLFSPAQVSAEIENRAIAIARKIVDAASFVGLLAIELFLTSDGELLVNEMAPRPHNSGHHTIEGCVTSQYAQHLRAILDLPPGDTSLTRPAVMVNLLGEQGFQGKVHYEGLEEVLKWPGVYVHLYGKTITKPFRKMGHVTITAPTPAGAHELARKVLQTIRVVTSE